MTTGSWARPGHEYVWDATVVNVATKQIIEYRIDMVNYVYHGNDYYESFFSSFNYLKFLVQQPNYSSRWPNFFNVAIWIESINSTDRQL